MTTLIIPKPLHDRVKTHLQGTYPNEGGGFLIGQIDGENRVVTEIHPVVNVFETEEQYHRYLMEDGAYQAAEDYADGQGLILIGYFHSHPDSPAIPSEFDRVHAFPNFMYLILSVQDAQTAESRVWELVSDRSQFIAVALEEKEVV